MSTTTKLSLGYGLGSMVRVGENLFGFYLVFYLSTTAGVSPGLAGAIGGVGLLVGALASPVIGFLSDRSKSRFGRRRPFMIATIIPSMVFLMLLFTRVDFGSATGIYYFVIAIAFSLTYYGFLVPYDTLGASLTTDYNQRTAIRSICTAVLYISVLVGGTLVLQVQSILVATMSPEAAWTVAVLVCCTAPGIVFGSIAWRVTRGQESSTPLAAAEATGSEDLLRSIRIFTLRPVWAILIWGFIYFFANAVMAGTVIYLGVYVLGLSEATAATYFTIATITTLITIVPGNYLAKALGKRNAILVAMVLFIATSLAMFFIGFDSYASGAVLMIAFGICNSIVLSCSYAMIYDLRELTELKLGDDKSAVILGWFSLVIGASGALAATTIGSVLQITGFNPEAPTQLVTDAIVALQTWVPAMLLTIAGLVLLLWNFSARSHATVTAQIQLIADSQPAESNDRSATR